MLMVKILNRENPAAETAGKGLKRGGDYAHHMGPLASNIITSLSMAMALFRPSEGVIRLSSCSMEMGPS